MVILSIQKSFPKDVIPHDNPWSMSLRWSTGLWGEVEWQEGDSSSVGGSSMGESQEIWENLIFQCQEFWFCQNCSRGWLERWELHKGDTRRIGRSQILKIPKLFQHYSERYKINLWISAARVIGTDVYWRVAEYAIPKMPLWHKDYFVLKAIQKKQIPEKLSTFLLFI